MLERDEAGIEADLPLDSWIAAFRAADLSATAAGMQDVCVNVSADTAGAALWTRDGHEVARAHGAPPLRLVEYAFHGVDDRLPAVVVRFSRAVAASSVVRERLVVQPGQVPSGTYRITLTIRDRDLALEAQAVRINVTLR
jgi:hypothetical protein